MTKPTKPTNRKSNLLLSLSSHFNPFTLHPLHTCTMREELWYKPTHMRYCSADIPIIEHNKKNRPV